MNTINCFSKDVMDQLGYYVYRLIDPRNGQTFYVGKGQRNRVFAHINDALKNYQNESYEEDKNENNENKDLDKMQTIREIRKEGLEVIHIIHRWGLTDKEAFEVEAALIDAYAGLTNIQVGHNSDRGVTNAAVLQKNLSAKQYDEPDNIKYIIIKIRNETVSNYQEEHPNISHEDCIYEATRSCWVISVERAKTYDYVLGVIDGIVKGVYKVKEWKQVKDTNRYEFEREDIETEVVNYFINKRIPDEYTKKGSPNPIQYCRK